MLHDSLMGDRVNDFLKDLDSQSDLINKFKFQSYNINEIEEQEKPQNETATSKVAS